MRGNRGDPVHLQRGENPCSGVRASVQRRPCTWAGEVVVMRQVLKQKCGEVGTAARKRGGSLDSSRV